MTIFHLTWIDLKIPWSLSPRGQLTLCVTWYGVHTMVLKACLMSKAALGGHSHVMKLGRRWGIFMGAVSVQCLTCQGIVYRAAQPHKPFAASHPSLLQLNWVNVSFFSPTWAQFPPSRQGLLQLWTRIHHLSLRGMGWCSPCTLILEAATAAFGQSSCETSPTQRVLTLTQSCKRLWGSAAGSLGTPENSGQ